MYFPYFRSKQYELVALRELAAMIASNRNIVPIIEPVKSNMSPMFTALKEFKKNSMPFVLVYNPLVGELKGGSEAIDKKIVSEYLKDYNNCFIGYIINNKTTLPDIEAFLKSHTKNNICLIHFKTISEPDKLANMIAKYPGVKYNIFYENNISRKYPGIFKDFDKVILHDGFNKEKNAEYPLEEFFSDRYDTYEEDGYKGFGDFLIVGDEYYEAGGPAYAVAIHLTYLHDSKDIWVKHFVSDDKGSPVNTPGKFLEALRKLNTFVTRNLETFKYSDACKEFLQLYKDQYFPGLGYVKKLSMKHHIELINQLIPKRPSKTL